MSQTQFVPVSMISQLAKSVGVELMIFAVTVVFAVAFRKSQRRGSKSKQHELAEPCPQHAKPTQTKALSTASSSKVSMQQPCGQPLSATRDLPHRDLPHRMELLMELVNKRQASDAVAVYEDLKRNDQQSIVKAFSRNTKFSTQERYGALIQCFVRANRPALIDELMDDMTSAGVQRSLAFYESTMKLLASKKWYREAMSVYQRLEADGLEPSPVTLSCLINFAVEISDLDSALAFFDRLGKVSTPSIRAYMMILRVHSKRQNWLSSVDVIRDMQCRLVKIDGLVLNVVLATGVSTCQLDGALALLEEFASIADVVSYNTLMKGFAQQRELDRAIGLLESMCQGIVKPNAITFNTVMDAAVRSSRLPDAWHVLERMRDAGHAPDKFTCTTLMKGLQNGATPEQLKVILDLLKNVSPQCDSTLCSSLFRSVIELAGQLNDPELTAHAVAQMREQRVMLPPHEYQRLLHFLTHGEQAQSGTTTSRRASHEADRPLRAC